MILYGTLRVEIVSAEAETTTLETTARINVAPIKTQLGAVDSLSFELSFDILPLKINFCDPIKQLSSEFYENFLNNFIDEERVLKTLLNLGEDKQSLVIHRRYGNLSNDGSRSLQLKLLNPLPNTMEIGKRVFISRELAKSTIDKTRIRYAPRLDKTPYLRPRNDSISIEKTGNTLKNVTLNVLSLQSGSTGTYDSSYNASFEDGIFRQWYSYDFNTTELNLDFTDYSEFIYYGSAQLRLAAFRQKLKELEKIDPQIRQFSGSIFTGSLATAGADYILETSRKLALQKEEIIRSFDRYEQHLYFTKSGSALPYSASFDYTDGGVEYNTISYWPKQSNGTLYSISSSTAIDWYTSQSAIAERYDQFNANALVNTIPTYIREDLDSDSYVTFVGMVGHFFDLIKPYIDQMPYIYDRYIRADEGLSKDLIETIAKSVGFTMPSLNSLYDLSDNILGEVSDEPRRDFTVETQKRLLHNLPLFAKSKGTRSALVSLLKSFGITEQILNVREEGIPETSSVYVYNEFTNGLDFDESQTQYVLLPLVDSTVFPFPRSLQFNFTAAKSQDMTVLTGDDKWKLDVKRHPEYTELGRIELISGSSTILSSSYEEIFGDELLNVAIRTYTSDNSANLYVTQVEGEDILFSSSLGENSSGFVEDAWNITNNIYLGGSGSYVTSRFDGTVDEVRLWGINLSNEMTEITAFDPGSNAGDAYTDASEYLYVQLSFNRIDTASLASNELLNETPYQDKVIKNLETVEMFNVDTTDFIRYDRTVKQLIPEIGQSPYVTRKIKIVPPPVFNNDFIGSGGSYILKPNRSIVSSQTKRRLQFNRNKVAISISPTQLINTNIIRSIGLENINSMIGVPKDFYNNTNTSLEKLKRHYAKYYYADININQYIRILSSVASVLNQVVDYFIPTRASLLQGVVIEQNILERVYIPKLKDIRFYGGNTRGTRRTINAANSLTSSIPDYQATWNLDKNIVVSNDSSMLGFNKLYDLQHLDWKDSLLVRESGSIHGKQKIDLTISEDILGNYNVYDLQHLDWKDSLLVRESGSIHRKQRIDVEQDYQTLGRYITYDLQHLDWKDSLLVRESGSIHRKQRIDAGYTSTAVYKTYDLQHLDWKDSLLVRESGSIHRKQRIERQYLSFGDYKTYDLQHLDWKDNLLVRESGSIHRKQKITATHQNSISAEFKTYDLQHLDWYEWRVVSESILNNTNQKQHKKQRIDLRLNDMNKIPFNNVNGGTKGAEPYNRLYTRKLYDYEIQKTQLVGSKGTNNDALYEIKPYANFDNFSVTNYYNHPEGVYYFPEIYVTPIYKQELNATWNFTTQTFTGATTWSYGKRYSKNDVVFQDISPNASYFNALGSSTSSALLGNKKYYVFKLPQAPTSPGDGFSSYVQGAGIPSFTPPSLDGVKWERLLFRPTEIREPKRVIFDTVFFSDPKDNAYKTTQVSLTRIINDNTRYVDRIYAGSLGAGNYNTGEIALQNISVLFALQSNVTDIRVRFYRTAEDRNNDVARGITEDPPESSGLLLDMTIDDTAALSINPLSILLADSTPPGGRIFYTINNQSPAAKASIYIDLFYYAIQVQNKVPLGYLRTHYRFYRDNSTATKRRNWYGCKNTIETTIDGLPPVQVFIKEGTQLIVSNTLQDNEITLGGGGTLQA